MNYTIVWNENKTEGIILSGENVKRNVKKAITGESNGQYSTLAGEFYETYGEYSKCTRASLSEPTQEMIEAGTKEFYYSGNVERIYKAMIEKLTCNP